ncbi:DUF1553 domain-containing protein [Rubinisphaera brasiliensis]|uniref:LamG-like jellyroll fold domain-containing protein n=1 Tax=Rubinisphaera brasiliensis (strain ATCC 49424 / DSM 5305 / JCM 21570 / IAM 15109 / NBRC 103401 / IFAM 1448) TaxID=756272 RepID=F0SQ16_RUBBR|nr:DUF1553 domain-containing protein [Rubinisphaera brasiliensis]ADY61193.1 protein of unknown function DUF1549 [Rubinisphaera brasiliensis DSM 5305]
MKNSVVDSAVLCAVLAIFCVTEASPLLAESPVASPDFTRDVRPLLSEYCFHCHGPEEEGRKAELRLDDRASAVEMAAIIPGDPAASELIRRIRSHEEYEVMPPPESKKAMSPEQIAILERWIAAGAEYEAHWAFVKPEKQDPPQAESANWGSNAIDAFVLHSLQEQGLTPSPEAARAVLIRRVSYDLTGLPPSLEELQRFQNMPAASWYEQMVDYFLAKPAFGERMALAWMDAARYGDTSVFHADGPRDMWPWRDWVIESYNSNKPFNEFTVEQIAGDLLPDASPQQLIASGFHRNNATTDEGGAIAEEYRVEYVVDRVKTTANVWLGISMECAQCHSHKYDPISQEEYYGFYAFFNQTTDPGMQTRRGNQVPVVNVPDAELDPQIAAAEAEVKQLKRKYEARVSAIEEPFQEWLKEATAEAKAGKGSEPPSDFAVHFPLDETEGKQVLGQSNLPAAAELKGEVAGKPNWTTGRNAGGFETSNKNFLNLGNVGNFDHNEAVSYGLWMKPKGKPGGAPLAKMNEGNKHRGWDLFFTGDRASVHIIHSWPDKAIKVTTKSNVPGDKWTHLFATYDGSGKAAGVKIYVNGESQPLDINNDSLAGQTTVSEVHLKAGGRHQSSPFTGQVDDVRIYPRVLTEAEIRQLADADPIAPLLLTDPAERTDEQTEQLRKHYLAAIDKQAIALNGQQQKVQKRLEGLKKKIVTCMVMKEQDKPRETYVLMRGHYASPDENRPVDPSVPSVFPPLPEDAPKNRLGLARWLVHPDHPLTARVTVNRYWMMLFGRGLVSTAMDFGSQGAFPTHPELLDWLAVDFVESGWDIKRMLKQMIMSATYRQSSLASAELVGRDAENELLARGPRFRLQGEMIRDTALAVSGLLVEEVGGPGVKPYQPAGLWNEVSLSANVRFKRDDGEKLYRKSMYIYWKRSAPHPGMVIFDAPTRESCTVQRPRTNTPLQALYTLNDEQFVEAGRKLAERMMREGGPTNPEKIRFAYLLLTAQEPSHRALAALEELFRGEQATYTANPQAAQELLGIGEAGRDESLPVADLAAWTIVANVLLNMDAALVRY